MTGIAEKAPVNLDSLATMNGKMACKLLKVQPYTLLRLALAGKIRTTHGEGSPPRYVREDVEALAAERSAASPPPPISGRPPDKALRDLVAERLSPHYRKPESA